MNTLHKRTLWCLLAASALLTGVARADRDSDALKLFHQSSQSADFFGKSYGYAIFPTIGKGGIGLGVAHGRGDVYRQGRRLGRVTMNQVSIGAQLGGEAYSEIIFFKDRSAFDDFLSGNFEFSADAGAIAITAAADASLGTNGANAGASLVKDKAATAGDYRKGVVVFTIAKGGLMYHATIAGQKFTYQGAAGG